ncbi:hypothetical protein GCM10023194_79950 [Planotetraspora phitsanulokensis]
MLAKIDVAQVSGFDAVEVVKAAYRQLCHERARFLQAVLEVGLREPLSGGSVRRLEVPDEFGPDEVRAALVWSRRRSDATFERAWNVHRRLPLLGEEMLAGRLDEPRAEAFVRWTAGLTCEQAARVCELLLPQAPGWTVGELVEQIQRLVLAIDPQWAEKRYREAVRRRRVIGVRQEDGTATVSGLDLPMDRAAAGCERIDELARACKRAGDGRPIDHIRVDLFLGSLDGSFEGLADQQVVAHVLAHPFAELPSTVDPDSDLSSSAGSPNHASTAGGRRGARRADRHGCANPTSPTTRNGTGRSESDDSEDAERAGNRPESHMEGPSGSHDECRSEDRAGSRSESHAESQSESCPSNHAERTPHSRATQDSDGGVVGGAGPDSADEGASDGIGPRFGGDHDGDETCGGGIAPSNPPGCGPDSASAYEPGPESVERDEPPHTQRQGGSALNAIRSADHDDAHVPGSRTRAKRWTVGEVRVELTTLLGLDEHPAEVPGWGLVHAGLARRIVAGMAAGEWRFAICSDDGQLTHVGLTHHRPVAPCARPLRDSRRGGIVELQITQRRLDDLVRRSVEFDAWAGVLVDLARQSADSVATNGDTRSRGHDKGEEWGHGRGDPPPGRDRRRAVATLRRYLQIRGRGCSRPGCRVPATKTDQDHVIEWASGGASDVGNLHLVCRHDHRAKHQGRWLVTMSEPGLVVWTSPLGHDYASQLPPIMTALPRPEPRNWPDVPMEVIGDDEAPIMAAERAPEAGQAPDADPAPEGPGDLRAGERSTGRNAASEGRTASLLWDVPPF